MWRKSVLLVHVALLLCLPSKLHPEGHVGIAILAGDVWQVSLDTFAGDVWCILISHLASANLVDLV